MATTSLGFPLFAETDSSELAAKFNAISQAINDYLAPMFADTGWLDITSFHSGWSVPSGDVAQVRQIGKEVMFRGNLQHLTFAPSSFAAVANLPAGITSPPVGLPIFPALSNTVAIRAWAVQAGVLSGWASAASAAYYPLTAIRYRVD